MGHEVEISPEFVSTKDYDLFIFNNNTTLEAYKLIRRLRLEYEPVIFDCDHDIIRVPEDNPTYVNFMNQPHAAWNPLQAMRLVSAMTVPNQALKDYYSFLNDDIHILPNCVSLDDWKDVPNLNWGGVVIGWAGSPTHRNSLQLLKEPLLRIINRYKDVHLVFVGDSPPFPLPYDRVTVFPWCDYRTYQTLLKSFDIGLAPLSDMPFNESKSDLRLKEYACAGLPIVASNFGPYKEASGFGFAFDDTQGLLDTLIQLIEDPKLRERKGQFAAEWVKSWDIRNHIQTWIDVYQDVIVKARESWASY